MFNGFQYFYEDFTRLNQYEVIRTVAILYGTKWFRSIFEISRSPRNANFKRTFIFCLLIVCNGRIVVCGVPYTGVLVEIEGLSLY